MPPILQSEIKPRNYMTLFVDSSHCPKTGAAGWGSWAIRDGWERGRFNGGPIKIRDRVLKSSTEAELTGIALALWRHDELGDLSSLEKILIQCDSVMALELIIGAIPSARINAIKRMKQPPIRPSKSSSPVVTIVLPTIVSLLKHMQVEVRHVKGHKDPRSSGRSWVNNQCDEEARRHMKMLRREIYNSREVA